MVQGGRWEGGSGWGTRVHPWQIHVDVIQYCKVISPQLKEINFKKENKKTKNVVQTVGGFPNC